LPLISRTGLSSHAIAFCPAASIFPGESLSKPMPIETPCNKICLVDPATGLCLGCGRTLDEIARWTALTDGDRARIMAELPERVARREAPATVASEPR
jgi:predicted Fe-S protein YdhL (DUF1289 family)